MLKKITQSPYLNLFSGAILLFTAGYETWNTFGEASLGVHHGIVVFSIIQIVKTIPKIMHGLKEVEKAKDIIDSQMAI